MDRKEFFSKALLGGTVLFLAPTVLNSCSKKADTIGSTGNNTTIDLESTEFAALKTVGGYAYSGNIFIIRSSETSYTALSRTCTHEGCTISFNSSSNRLVCPCHGAIFSTEGAVIQGPATRSLTIYTATVSGTTLTIS